MRRDLTAVGLLSGRNDNDMNDTGSLRAARLVL